MKEDILISYEEALEILNGLPSPIRKSICGRIIQYLVVQGDELSRVAELPENHIEKLIAVHHASNEILKGIDNGLVDRQDAADAMSKLTDK